MKVILTALLGVSLFATQLPAQSFNTIHTFGLAINYTGFYPAAPLVQGPDGAFYGTTGDDGTGGAYGTVFKYVPGRQGGYMILKRFNYSTDGGFPEGALILNGNVLYGTARSGGSGNSGTIFKIDTDGGGFTVLKSFSAYDPNYYEFTGLYVNPDGSGPAAGLTLSGTTLYGTTYVGGNAGQGVIFQINLDSTGFTVLNDFSDPISSNCSNPYGTLLLTNNLLFGTTLNGGPNGLGTAFSVDTTGTNFSVLHTFGTGADGRSPQGGLTLNGSLLYGTTSAGGQANNGTIFALGTDGSNYAVVKNFSPTVYNSIAVTNYDGGYPSGELLLNGGKLYGVAYRGGANGNGTVYSLTAPTNFNTLYSFGFGPDGANPIGGLIVSSNLLAGITRDGGGDNGGTLFLINPNGSNYRQMLSFSHNFDGNNSHADVILSGGVLYGTTFQGGHDNVGTVYKMNPDGTGYAILKSFTLAEGGQPMAGLALSGNMLYGAASSGFLYQIDTDGGNFAVLKTFSASSNNPSMQVYTNGDGVSPSGNLLLVGSTLYGTAAHGGTGGSGTIFSIQTNGSNFTVLKNFAVAPYNTVYYNYTNFEGAFPEGGLTLIGANLYGTASQGDTNGLGAIFRIGTNGSGYTVLKTFSPSAFSAYDGQLHAQNADGAYPYTSLLAINNVLYGTTTAGGATGFGTVFKINPDGSGFTLLKNFAAVAYVGPLYTNFDGTVPSSSLTGNSNFLYGTTTTGGALGHGTLFRLNLNGTGFKVLKTFTGTADGGNPIGAMVLSNGTLYGTTASTAFSLNLTPSLWITTVSGSPLVYYQDDGSSQVMQTSASVASGLWNPAPPLNWTNSVNGQTFYGLSITNPQTSPAAFFRLQ